MYSIVYKVLFCSAIMSSTTSLISFSNASEPNLGVQFKTWRAWSACVLELFVIMFSILCIHEDKSSRENFA